MDAFYVGVELRRRPELRGRPVIVGGTGRRGVVASASYEARAYGVHSAQPSAVARRLCPHATFLAGDHAAYREASAAVMAIFARYSPLVEPLSLDEAFLDVTGAQRRAGAPRDLAAAIRRTVAEEQSLACSVGVAPTKFLAKLASEAAKPTASPQGPVPGAGVFVVRPGDELSFLHPLPLRALWGVGPATLVRLERQGIATVGGLAALPEAAVIGAVGEVTGRHLWRLARGIDGRAVVPDRPPKSIGHEETFAHDLVERADCERELVRLADAVAGRLRHHGYGGRTVTLKVRYGDFRTVTRSRTLAGSTDSGPALAREARTLLAGLDLTPGIRLLGVSASALSRSVVRQLSFDELVPTGGRGAPPPVDRLDVRSDGGARDGSDVASDVGSDVASGVASPEAWGTDRPARARRAGWEEAERAVDAIRDRFGDRSIGPAVLATGAGVRTLRQGEQAWGPEREQPAGSEAGPV
jgi:DNA polymerase-4